jgi:glucosamine--fructose-6-phosphate aminotransferase (isomerizing)
MFSEAAEAPAIVAGQLRDNADLAAQAGNMLAELSPPLTMTCARGSSDHAATFAKYLIERKLGVPTASAAPSVSSLYAARLKLQGSLCLAMSQSGRSPDLLSTAAAAKSAGARLVALVNDETSPLAADADLALPLRAGPERSVAATKSYVATLSAVLQLVASWSRDDELAVALNGSPDLLARSWELDWPALVEGLKDASSLYVIGRGAGLGIAQEAALKLKETCGLHAEAFSAAEVRHGPMALVKPGFPVLIFRQRDEGAAGIDALATDLVDRGANVLIVGPPQDGATSLPGLEADPDIEPMLQILSFYRAANALALARGLDPDKPPHLMKVTETR